MTLDRLSLPRTYTQKILRAIREFDLIQPGDRVLVGFSGGKDSSFLIYALSIFQKHRIVPFELGAITVDLGFKTEFNLDPLKSFCAKLGVEFHSIRTEIAKYAFAEDNSEGPCATCSFLRRATMNRFANEHGYNVIALAHHQDDAVETFLMSILFSGQIKTFLPHTKLSRTDLNVIRPLIYLREAELRQALEFTGFNPVSNPCPRDGKSQRAVTKELIRKLCLDNKAVFDHLSSAIRAGRPIKLWPAELSREEIQQRNPEK